MHRVRKDRSSHRRLRTRVLAALLAAVGALAALASCSGGKPGAPARASWFQLQAGAFQPVAGPGSSPSVSELPWTIQSRVADMAFLGSTLYCAVNGTGLAAIELDAAGAPVFAYHADPLIFAHRTITTLVPRQGTLAVHLYFNALLNDARQRDLPISGISIVCFLPAQSDFSFLIPPFQRRNPDWEAVGFAPESENQFDFEWKYTDPMETRFAYTRYRADTQVEEGTSRDAYLAALGVPSISGSQVPSDLGEFFETCRKSIPRLAPYASLQFALRSRENPVRRSYRSQPVSDSAVMIPVFEEEGARLALIPGGRVIASAASSRPIDLPGLPRAFRYTDFVKVGDLLIVAWEETAFTNVGRAGLLLFRPRP
ncbi:MAG: hypothetical protein ABSB63_09980 [Spirochaetia bacterium]